MACTERGGRGRRRRRKGEEEEESWLLRPWLTQDFIRARRQQRERPQWRVSERKKEREKR